jgi:hypothetical protein
MAIPEICVQILFRIIMVTDHIKDVVDCEDNRPEGCYLLGYNTLYSVEVRHEESLK